MKNGGPLQFFCWNFGAPRRNFSPKVGGRKPISAPSLGQHWGCARPPAPSRFLRLWFLTKDSEPKSCFCPTCHKITRRLKNRKEKRRWAFLCNFICISLENGIVVTKFYMTWAKLWSFYLCFWTFLPVSLDLLSRGFERTARTPWLLDEVCTVWICY